MKIKKMLITVLSAIVTALTMNADYPTLYLRGELTNSSWAAEEHLRFNNNNGVYTLHLDELHGQFKIADAKWNTATTFGADSERDGEISVTAPGIYPTKCPGQNFGCNDPLTDVTITFTYKEGENIIFEIKGNGGNQNTDMTSGTLPVLHINVYNDESHLSYNNAIISKDLANKDYFSFAEYWLDMNGCEWMQAEGAKSIGSEAEPLPLEIKIRGNWTCRGFSKKPFKLKLGSKQKMLGMTKSKHFALLAHADDYYGYLRNFTGFNLGKRIGLPWTPAQQPVEVIINGDYRGLYFLTESIRVEPDRININELDDEVSDPALVSGGYVVELDNYDETNQIRMEERSCVSGHYNDMLRITWDTPEIYSDLQKRFITDQFSEINNAVGDNSDRLWSYLDLDDAARYYLVEEIISHTESYHGSTYLFRDRGGNEKWHFSPLWDCGNAFSGPDNDFFYNADPFGNTWIPSMRENPTFNEKVKATWMWFMNNRYNGIEDDIKTYVSHLKQAALADFKRWDGKPVPDGGLSVVDNRDLESRQNTVINKLRNKISWLKQHFGDYSNSPLSPEPERDTTPAAPLPDYVSGVENVTTDNISAEYSVEYFDITGRRITTPAPGSIIIERCGSSVRKIRY